jgi:uncharacterized SAM-binding protein YcdF (DUF218 family)
MIADWLGSSGLAGVKPFLAVLALPPVPLLFLALVGAWLARARPHTGRALVVLACLGLWLAACVGSARWVEDSFLDEPAALGAAQRQRLKTRAAAGAPLAIVVLGGGVDTPAPEYGTSTLGLTPLARLRYATWLSRETGIPLAASGGRGWAASSDASPSEADVMASVARTDFGVPIRWIEDRSRDTHENAVDTVRMLSAAGVGEIVVVTNGWHMPRALREFRAAVQAIGAPAVKISAAPMGLAWPAESPALTWMPSGEGAQRMRAVLREVLASLLDRR